MEFEFSKRKKGSDKKKERYERNGKFSTKHVRLKNEQTDRSTEQKTEKTETEIKHQTKKNI